MAGGFRLIAPTHVPPLEPEFRPAVLANRAFREEVAASGAGVPLVIALERLRRLACRATRRSPSRMAIRAPMPTSSTPSAS